MKMELVEFHAGQFNVNWRVGGKSATPAILAQGVAALKIATNVVSVVHFMKHVASLVRVFYLGLAWACWSWWRELGYVRLGSRGSWRRPTASSFVAEINLHRLRDSDGPFLRAAATLPGPAGRGRVHMP